MSTKIFELRGMIYSKFENEAKCAESLGWKRQKLSKITNGKKVPDISELYALSQALGSNVETLIQIFLNRESPNEQRSA